MLVTTFLFLSGCSLVASTRGQELTVSEPSLVGPSPVAIEVTEFYYGERTREAVAFYANFLSFLEAEWRQACATGRSISTACLYQNRRISISHNGHVAMVAIIPPIVTEETILPQVATADDVERETPVFAAKRMAHETARALGLLRPLLRKYQR